MKYSTGECLIDYGFKFFELLREPIAIVHKSGQILRLNDSAQTLLRLSRQPVHHAENWMRLLLQKKRIPAELKIETKNKTFRLRCRKLEETDYFLLEIHR